MAAQYGNQTIKDVARLSGVSSMTLSRVINGSERVSPETRWRVEQAIAELGYVPSLCGAKTPFTPLTRVTDHVRFRPRRVEAH
jgi:transcriptional regulator with XRE-family HTH domain